MKKMVFTLALLLMSLSAALAQTWDFAGRDPFIGDADEALINADATNWYKMQQRVVTISLQLWIMQL